MAVFAENLKWERGVRCDGTRSILRHRTLMMSCCLDTGILERSILGSSLRLGLTVLYDNTISQFQDASRRVIWRFICSSPKFRFGPSLRFRYPFLHSFTLNRLSIMIFHPYHCLSPLRSGVPSLQLHKRRKGQVLVGRLPTRTVRRSL